MTQQEKQKNSEKDIIVRRAFRLSQKALFYNPQARTYLILRVGPTKSGSPAHTRWMEKYGPMDLPGGHMDEGETDLYAAFVREVQEETGVDVSRYTAVPCHTVLMINEGAQYPSGVNTIALVQYDGEIVLSEEHMDMQWLTAQEVEDHGEIKEWIKESVRKAQELIALREADDRWRRCVADFDNYKKRQAQTQKDLTAYAAEGVIMDLLPVVDNFHAATDHIPADQADNPWVTGIMYIRQQMEKVFEEKGVTRMEVKSGDVFDPSRMEAVKENEDDTIDGDAVVKKVVQPGYMMGERVLRVARVAVGRRVEK